MLSRLVRPSDLPFDGPLRVAVFGTGYWSTLQIPAWRETKGVEVVAAYNRTRSKVDAVAARFGIPRVYDDPEALLRSEDVDFIDIITEVPAHASLVQLAARQRIPVICQKPMGESLDQCREMVDACREARIPFLIHENFRWQPPLRAVKEALDEQLIGEPLRAHIQLASGGAAALALQPFLKTLPHLALTDMGSHVFDLARFYFGEPQSVYCQTFKTSTQLNSEDMATALLRIGNCMCTCEISERISQRVFVEGRHGALELRLDNTLKITTSAGEEVRDCRTWPRYGWVSQADDMLHGGDCIHSIVACHRHLVRSLREGARAETSAEDNFKTMRVMFAAIESCERGEVVRCR